MPKFTIIVETESVDRATVVDAWLDRWEGAAEHISDNLGCGCCVNIYQVDAPGEALAELPDEVVSWDEWTK